MFFKVDKAIPGDVIFVSGILKAGENEDNNKFKSSGSNIFEIFIDVKNIVNVKDYYFSKYKEKCIQGINNESVSEFSDISARFLNDEIDVFNDIGSNEDTVMKLLVK